MCMRWKRRFGLMLVLALLAGLSPVGAEEDEMFLTGLSEDDRAAVRAQPTQQPPAAQVNQTAPDMLETQAHDEADEKAGEEASGQAEAGANEASGAYGGYTAMSEPGVWHYPIPYELLTDTNDLIRLVNEDSLLDEKYKPRDLVRVKARKVSYDPMELRKEASEALSVMFEDAEIQGVMLYALSAYRSYGTQATMHYNRLKANNGVDDRAVAMAGASDHQTGLGADVIGKAFIGERLTSAFTRSKEALWLAEHCWEYGFVVRYPDEKQEITRIIYEPWHLRYVGLEVAAYMMNNDLCLEEFTEEWQAEVAAFEGR